MARMWFRCPVCGTMMQGDPRYPPLCPNAANHAALPPGPLPQQPYFSQQPFPGMVRATPWQRFKRLPRGKQGAIGLLAFLVAFFALGFVLSPIFALISNFAPAGSTTPTPATPITDATFGGTLAAFQAKYGPG